MKWPWSRREDEIFRAKALEQDRLEIQKRQDILAEIHLDETGQHIAKIWADAEAAIAAKHRSGLKLMRGSK